MKKKTRWLCAALALSGSACATVQQDGFLLHASSWRDDSARILLKAAPDLQCPKDGITLTVMDVDGAVFGGGKTASQVDAAGCGRHLIYYKLSVAGGYAWTATT